MKGKPVLFFLFLFSLTFSRAQVAVGIVGGVHRVGASVKINNGPPVSVKPGYGFHIGGTIKATFDKNIYFAPQLLYSTKQFTLDLNNILQDSVTNDKLSLHYIELPVLLEFDTKPDGTGFFFLFGPSFSVAIAGNEERQFIDGEKEKRPMKFAYTGFTRFEMNLIGKAGYRFEKNWSIMAGYSLGLGSIVNDDLGPRIRPRMITFTVGYFLPGKL